MPKIINHEQYRVELAQKAIDLFSQHGYTGLGMRKIAQQLGISKSALYHYFPSKQALFHACTELVTRFDSSKEYVDRLSARDATIADQVSSLVAVIRELEPTFPDELSLLLDYLRGRAKEDIANDPTMQLANQRYEILVKQFVADKYSKPVLCTLLGTLLMRFFDGGNTSFGEIEDWLIETLEKGSPS